MERAFVALAVCVLTLAAISPGSCGSGTVVDLGECRVRSLPCGQEDQGSNRQYCCVESDGGNPLFFCCNPYISLAIGLSVGIPLLAAIIVGVVVAVCYCSHYHNKKMDRLMVAYRQARLEDEQNERAAAAPNPAAPPAYTPVANDKSEPGLPLYTESDPYTKPPEPAPGEAHLEDVPLVDN